MSDHDLDSDSPLLPHRGRDRPGLLLRHPDDKSPFNLKFKESDVSLLESRLEVKIGEDKVKKIKLSADRLHAYVELVDEAGEHTFLNYTG